MADKLSILNEAPGFNGYLTTLNPKAEDGYIASAPAAEKQKVVDDTESSAEEVEENRKKLDAISSAPAADRSTIAKEKYGEDEPAISAIYDAYTSSTPAGSRNMNDLADLISSYQSIKSKANRRERAIEVVDEMNDPNGLLNDPASKEEEIQRVMASLEKDKNLPASEAEEKARQAAELRLEAALKFGPQRYLLKNINKLSGQAIRRKSFSTPIGIPYDKTVALQNSSTNVIGRLTKRENASKIMGLSTDKLSALVPKIQIFKVEYDDNMNEKGRTPIRFPKGTGVANGNQWQPDITDIFERLHPTPKPPGNNPESFYKTRAGYGIQSFSWSYIGADTYSANRDITASLVLYFQDFAQLSVERIASTGGKYRYLDLLLAISDEKFLKRTGGKRKKPLKRIYQQDIVAEVGWSTPNSFTDEEKDIITNNSVSLVLTMEDYSITFDEGATGTFILQIDYRARAERIARDKLVNVIAPLPATVREIKDLQDEVEVLKAKGSTEDNSYTEKKDEFDAKVKESKKESYQRMTKMLADNNSIYFTDISLADIISSETSPSAAADFKKPSNASATIDYLERCNTDGNTKALFDGAADPSGGLHRFYYTFLGDIVEVAMRIACDPEVAALWGAPLTVINKYKVILADFYVGSKPYNLADLPIDMRLVASFFYDKIQAEDTQTKTIGIFIKDLLSYIVNNKIENYFNAKKGDSRSFRTSFITLDTDIPTTRPLFLGVAPAQTLLQGPGTPYLVVHANSSATDLKIEDVAGGYATQKGIDEKNNLAHLTLGNRDSVIKNISFEKLDWEYAREHRLVENAGSPFNILANVFNVTVKLFGNTLFQPGSMVFIYPASMGDIGRPWVNGSISNIMGLGGYHFVTKVDNIISDGTFETSITAIWQTSGDGSAFIDRDGS